MRIATIGPSSVGRSTGKPVPSKRPRVIVASDEEDSDRDGKKSSSIHDELKELRAHLMSVEAMVSENAKFMRSVLATIQGGGILPSSKSTSSSADCTPIKSRRTGSSGKESEILSTPTDVRYVKFVRELRKKGHVRVRLIFL